MFHFLNRIIRLSLVQAMLCRSTNFQGYVFDFWIEITLLMDNLKKHDQVEKKEDLCKR